MNGGPSDFAKTKLHTVFYKKMLMILGGTQSHKVLINSQSQGSQNWLLGIMSLFRTK